ncbi:MAG: hypothetical protein JNL82_13740 [Myxococcales bacterium]|nr:hypothetical protein [Myxococcales bacterium]
MQRWIILGAAVCAACGDDGQTTAEGGSSSSSSTVTTPGPTSATLPTSDTGDDVTASESASGTATSDSTAATSTGAPTTAAPTGDPTGDTGDTGTASSGTTSGVQCGRDCADQGGVCVGDTCCPTEDQACGDVCCDDGDFCSFNTCVTPGSVCIDASACADDEYCEYSLGEPEMPGGMCAGGVTPATGKCLPAPPECMDGEDPGDPPTCLAKCEYIPVAGPFEPEVKHHWDKGTVMMAPIVIQLDDDSCDEAIDERDIPEIVFTTFVGGVYQDNGTIRVISIVDGAIVEKWTYNAGMVDPIAPGRELAGGDIDGLPGNEVVACTTTGKVKAFAGDGALLWTSAAIPGGCAFVSLADLDQDGNVEVVVPGGTLDGATGMTELTFPAGFNTPADLDNDGQLDIVQARFAYNAAGGMLASTGVDGLYPAVGDFDLDGKAEVAAISNNGATLKHHLVVWQYDAAAPNKSKVIRSGIDINGMLSPALCPMGSAGNTRGGGPPTIADFNGDGHPDVAVAGGVGYAVFDGKKLMDPAVADIDTFLWIKQTQDCSSAATGSSVFDFNGDGSAEVVYSDEIRLRIYNGNDGTVLWETCNTTGTLVEYPLVADVDSDGHADIVAVSNNYSSINCMGTKQTGVRIFGDSAGNWVRTRRVWNEHSYHVTNVEEGGAIPALEASNWTLPGLNNFRQNVQPEGEFSAPDLIVDLRLQCAPEDYGLVARVRNIGQAAVPAGVPVYYYEGDPDDGGSLLGLNKTGKVLYPAEAEDVPLVLPNAPQGVVDGTSVVWVVVDDAMPAHVWHECRTDNNRASGSGQCPMPG